MIVYIIFEYVQKPFSLWKTNINNSIYLYTGYTPKSVTIAIYSSWGATVAPQEPYIAIVTATLAVPVSAGNFALCIMLSLKAQAPP